MRVYADFNAQIDPGAPDRNGLVSLNRLGTLRDLCALRIRLREGLRITLYMDSDEASDIEVDAEVRWLSASQVGANGLASLPTLGSAMFRLLKRRHFPKSFHAATVGRTSRRNFKRTV